MTINWTDPKTWTVGEKIRAADLNAQMRDNLLFLYTRPQAALRLTGPQPVASGADHEIVWDELVWGEPAAWWDVGAPSKLVVQRDGLYHVVANVRWDDPPDDGKRNGVWLHVNGNRRRGVFLAGAEMQVVLLTSLSDGDVLHFEVFQNSGAAVDLTASNRTVVTVQWAGPLL